MATASAFDRNAQRFPPTASYVRCFGGLCVVAAHLLYSSAAELDARGENRQSHRTAALRRADELLAGTRLDFVDDDPLASPMISALVGLGVAEHQPEETVAEWAKLIVPLQIVDGPRTRHVSPPTSREPALVDKAPVAVAIAYIDDLLVTGTQVLRPETVNALRLEARGEGWPNWADRLDAEILSHLTQGEAQTPTFTWKRPPGVTPEDSFVVEGEGTLVVRFGLAAGRPAPPFLVSLRLRDTRDGQPFEQVCDVAGHSELRLRPFDYSRDALTQYRMVDERLLQLYDGLHKAGYNEDHVQAFCRLLTATCRAGMDITWDRQYRRGRKVSEREFHEDLFARIQEDPELEGRLERGSPLGLGFLDVRHDGITAELKVERQTPVARDSVAKYIGQPTQYAAADGARLSILCVLDMSPKTKRIVTAENYLWQLGPEHHGLTNSEAPSL